MRDEKLAKGIVRVNRRCQKKLILLHEGFPKPETPPTVDIGVLCLRLVYIYREKNSPYLYQLAIWY